MFFYVPVHTHHFPRVYTPPTSNSTLVHAGRPFAPPKIRPSIGGKYGSGSGCGLYHPSHVVVWVSTNLRGP